MKTRIGLIMIMFLLFAVSFLGADVWFDRLNLSESGELLFSAHSDGEGAPKQNALFSSQLKDRSLRQLTAFPENIDVLEGGRTIQIRNTFGVFRIPITGGLPQTIPGFQSFADGAPALGGRAESMVSSSDGNWILFIEADSAAYGNLILLNTLSGAKTLISEHIERPGRHFPACWSPDSQVFVYSRAGKIYYYAIGNVQMDEHYRMIGDGTINSVKWGLSGDFFYMKGSSVYRVRGTELFARALYANFLEIGTVTGTIPLEFDPNFDEFWIAPDSQSLLLAKENRSLFYFPLEAGAPVELSSVSLDSSSLPYLILPRSSSRLTVLWSNQGIVTILVSIPEKNGFQVNAYRVNLVGGNLGSVRIFARVEDPLGESAALSPDGSKALVWGENGIFLYDYAGWKTEQTIGRNPSHAAVWLDNNEYIIGDAYKIERVRAAGPRSLICLSSSDESGYEAGQGRVLSRVENAWYVTNGKTSWQPISSPVLKAVMQVSSNYRVYLEPQASGPYNNIPMIRNISSVGTFALFPGREGLFGESRFVENDLLNISPEVLFTHGLRNGLRELSLSFDLIDDDRGLPQALDVLNRFGVKATFFLNGEFIRRHPDAAKNIADAGHETASMFFAPIDLSDARYTIDKDFIMKGLARNEDEFFSAAQAELSLLWHAPYYFASSDMMSAASSAGYRTIGRDVDPMDWVLRKDVRGAILSQLSAPDIVDRIMRDKKPGSIIAIRLGLLPGGRDDYLFNNLDLLLDALTKNGYSVVPISTLIDHSR